MAIGARITSTNLSGKTATVTFVPYTGQTSGSTVNLGTKVIPFNHINSHPYGVYSLHFAEYDYTYTLTVPEPTPDGVQMFVHSNRMIESDNYGAVTLNFNDFTAEIIDLDVNINDWGNRDIYEITEGGLMYYFRGVSNSDDRLVVFTDSSNTEIGRYSGTTDSIDRNSLEGRWVTAEFDDLGVLKYSDGVSLYEYTWNPVTHYIDIEWDWDAVASDGTFIIKKYERGQWNYNGDGESYLVNPNDGTTTLFKTWSDGTQVTHRMHKSADFIVVETQTQGISNTYTNFQICNTSGGILESVSLTGDTYNDRYTEFHGTNKFTTVYFNGNDGDIDYKIIHYNGNTESLVQTSHVRGSYNNISMAGRGDDWVSGDGTNPGAVVISFYNNIGYDNIGQQTTFCDFVYMLDNQTSFSTYTFANDETKTFAPWGFQVSDVIKVLCDNGDGVVSLLTIMSGSTRTESMNVFVSGTTQINYDFLGNKTLLQIYSNSNSDVAFRYVNAVGVVTDELNYTLSTQYGSNMTTMGEVGYIRMQTANDGELGFYVYGNNVDFNPTGYYTNTRTPDFYDSETKELPDVIFLFSEGGGNGRVLSSTGVTSQFEIPVFNSYNTRMGKDKFMIVYSDFNDNDYVKINLYNFSGTLLNTTSTTYTTWNDSWGAKDRFVVRFTNNDNNLVFYLISEDVIESVVIQNYDGETSINDYVWND